MYASKVEIAAILACFVGIGARNVRAMPLAEALDAPATAAKGSAPVRVADFHGPLLHETLGNPSILEHQGMYYAFASHSGKGGSNYQNVPSAKSKNLGHGWEPAGDAMPYWVGGWAVDPTGSDSDLWTPDVSQLDDGRFIMYYSAKSKAATERCIGYAYATQPLGPYKAHNESWYCPPRAGAIGVDGIQDGKSRYVIFKDGSFGGGGGASSTVGLIQVDPKDGVTKKNDKPKQLTNENPNKPGWEGPAITKMPDGKYLLLHTTGIWTEDYEIHWAISDKIEGIYKEGGVLIGTGDASAEGNKVYRPGGPDFIGTSNTEFTFFADPKSTGKGRVMYYGTLKYANGQVTLGNTTFSEGHTGN